MGVQFTQPIKDLAAQLEHHPVKIYNYVRNSIEYIPTQGLIQGAQQTLDTKRGNSADTSALLVALLRSSGIPARIVYGTVEIPIEKVMNWVGGVTKPEAALQILGQGGIPNVGLTKGGQFYAVRMEHFWVEAWVDFFPSRGYKNIKGDSWISMDGSFKQYEYTKGMELTNNVPFDAQNFTDTLQQTAQINETEGWVQGIDQNYIQTSLGNYQTQLTQYIAQTQPNATVGDVLGRKTIIPVNHPTLASGLPYPKATPAQKMAEFPETMQLGFQYELFYGSTQGTPLLSFSRGLSELAGKRVTLSFSPATQADQDIIASYLPEIPEGSELDPSTLPTSFPGYLINVIAEFKVDGEVVATSNPIGLGEELASITRISRLSGGWHQAVNYPIAGEFYAFGIDGQGISAQQLETVKTRLETVKTKLENQDVTGLTKDGLIGDMLHAAVTSYFAAHDANMALMRLSGDALAYRQPSFGVFSTSIDIVYRFGIPHAVKMGGIAVDMDAVAQTVWAKNHDAKFSKASVQQLGMLMSSLEHRIPELFFTNEDNPGEAISAVKALELASTQGQKIYQITSANVSVLNRLLINDEIKSDIVDAVAAGKEVLVSEGTISVNGWSGVGYIVSNPDTGSAAYRISGGSNGGVLAIFIGSSLIALGLFLIFSVFFAIYLLPAAVATLSTLTSMFTFGLGSFLVGLSYINPDDPWSRLLCNIGIVFVTISLLGIHTIIDAISGALFGITLTVASELDSENRACR